MHIVYVSGIEIQGFRGLSAFSARGLGRLVRVRGPGPSATALGDALGLVFGSLCPHRLADLLDRWGLLAPDEKPDITADPLPEQATWADRFAARELTTGEGERRLRARVELELDPPQFGVLRAQAAREPRLVTALADGAVVRIAVSAHFASSWDALMISVQEFEVGGAQFPTAPSERPPWMTRFLLDLAHRFHHHDSASDPAADVLRAATSRDRFSAFRAWQTSLQSEVGEVRPAHGPGDRPILLANERPLRLSGSEAIARVAMSSSVHLSGADVLWLEGDCEWADVFVEGDRSPLEQVWRVTSSGELDPTGRPDVLPFDTKEGTPNGTTT